MRHICVLMPGGIDSLEMLLGPLGFHIQFRSAFLEIQSGSWIQNEQQPRKDENCPRRNGLSLEWLIPKQKQKNIPQSHLRQHVRHPPTRHRAIRSQEDTQEDQNERSDPRMTQHALIRLSLTLTFHVRVRHRQAHHEHEGRLHHVPITAAHPLGMGKLILEEGPESRVWICGELQPGRSGDSESAEGQRHHDKTAVSIEREESFRFLGIDSFRGRVAHEELGILS